jgi:hypothetical protein
MRPLDLVCYGHRLRTNGGWNILRNAQKKKINIHKKGGSVEDAKETEAVRQCK